MNFAIAAVGAIVANKQYRAGKKSAAAATRAGDADRAKADQARDIASLESNRIRRGEAESSTLVAAAQNHRSRPSFLSKVTGFGGLRSRLGGNRAAA